MQELFEAVISRKIGNDICFLCGCDLNEENRTREHVIPRWAQERYQLWDQKMILLNRTEIPYRQLTIPCCFSCNNKHLRPIEDEVSEAVLAGVDAVRNLDRQKLYIWLSKIYYGLLYKENFLQAERHNPESAETITNHELMMEFQMLHYFLQSSRVSMVFRDFFPASIMIFEAQEPTDPLMQWDFGDDLHSLFIAVRMGKVAMFAVLMDGGANEYMATKLLDYVNNIKLHPHQFREILVMVKYKSLLFNRVPKYMIVEGDPIQVIQAPLAGFSNKPLFNDWNQEQYAKLLSQYTGAPFEKIYFPPDQVWTWLKKSDGTVNHMPLAEYPFPPNV